MTLKAALPGRLFSSSKRGIVSAGSACGVRDWWSDARQVEAGKSPKALLLPQVRAQAKRIVAVVPVPGVLSICTGQPNRSPRRRTIDRPMPLPTASWSAR